MVTNVTSKVATVFKKLYHKDTMLQTDEYAGKRNSSICSFVINGRKEYGNIQKFILSPPMVLIKPYQKTSSSFLKSQVILHVRS